MVTILITDVDYIDNPAYSPAYSNPYLMSYASPVHLQIVLTPQNLCFHLRLVIAYLEPSVVVWPIEYRFQSFSPYRAGISVKNGDYIDNG
jgi:hypothetical protein